MKHLLLVLPLLFPLSASAQTQIWNNPESGVFATSLIRGDHGDWWAGADDEGLFHRDAMGNWTQLAGQKELGDNNVTCIAVDPGHRVWVGTASAGVTVYHGNHWKRYSVWNGPLSNRINALKVDSSGAVWGATDAGLFRWSEKDGWEYPGVFAGDPPTRDAARKPVYALAFEAPNSVLEATDDGLNRISLVGGQPRIEPVGRSTSKVQPPRAQGQSFLPGPVQDVAFDSAKQIWCATRYGVCLSKDAGATWRFLRGADWQANARGSAVPLVIDAKNPDEDPLAEDWVTTLAPTADGKMWLGFRQKGAEERDCHTLELIVSTRDDPKFATQASFGGDWTSAIVPLGGDSAAFARYGGGLGSLFGANLPTLDQERIWTGVTFPENAKFPPQLLAGLARNLNDRKPLKVGEGIFYSLDRETRGDWPLRYGNEGGELWGTYDSNARLIPPGFSLEITTGPHRTGNTEDRYVYVHELSSVNPNVVQMPWRNIRRQAEVNDGTWQGGKYPYSFDGPDLWTTLSVPEGLHRVAFYWYNKDGHSGDNRMRDHRVELFSGDLTPTDCLNQDPLAKARLWSGWNGEYASFAVRGPAKFQVRIARDRSHATQLQAVFFDRLGAPQPRPSWVPERFQLPVAPPLQTPDNPIATLWTACDQAESRGVPCPLERTIALRAARDSGASTDLLAAWRVQAGLWDEEDTDRKAIALNNAN
ncbi:hypothetical protein IAD21_03272 [Abditibacteriota bacterium]|nr:hypothetical protein IAD21_03272 [Abditibacteriota bacterium]